ncbi:MAG: CpsD/CapB family tyrosine-protein kinase [Tepidibacillus sp.]
MNRNVVKENRYMKLITFHDPKNPVAEAFRTIRTNIQFASIDNPLRSIMVTSTGPSEGKSTIIANLAVVMAQSEKKVLLIDADLRKPTVHHTFHIPNRVGLTNLLVGDEEIDQVVQQSELPNLSILTSGPIPPNPAELLSSKKMSRLVEEFVSSYDLVLFDAPPVVAVTDAQILSGYTDGVMLVVNAGKTHREMALKAKQQLEHVQANVIGVILNNKDMKEQGYYYYYYGQQR